MITRICCLLYGEDHFHLKGSAAPVRPSDPAIPLHAVHSGACDLMIQVCAVLIRSCSMPQTEPRVVQPPTHLNPTETYHLSARDSFHFFHKPFFTLLMEQVPPLPLTRPSTPGLCLKGRGCNPGNSRAVAERSRGM